jgi:excisionase family DNA binding protein
MSSGSALPLTAASARLRGKPGRPRTKPRTVPKATPVVTAAVGTITPRLLDLEGAAAYLSVSSWTVRDLVDSGRLRRVRLPGPRGADLRRVLLDVRELDSLVSASTDGPLA